MTSKRTALYDLHLELGAKTTDFGGWEMPLQYPSGTIAEHMSCRTGAALFDVSHLGTVTVTGPDAYEMINSTVTNDLSKVAPTRAQYTHLLAEEDASVVDDIIVWWLSDGAFHVMPNASNTDNVVGAIGGRDITAERSILALQGPEACALAARIVPEVAGLKRFHLAEFTYRGSRAIVAATGYTGEMGVEFFIPAEHSERFFRALLALGATPAGLGARDTLRLEAGLPLHGHELGAGITPLEARLGWVVGFNKERFRGKDALLAHRAQGLGPLLHGVASSTRQPLRAGMSVLDRSGEQLGFISSGNVSPVLGHGIGFAFLDGDFAPGTPLQVDSRGRLVDVEVAAYPFVNHITR